MPTTSRSVKLLNPGFGVCLSRSVGGIKCAQVRSRRAMNRWRPNMCVDARSRRLFRAALGAAQLRELLLVWPDRHDFFVSGGVMLQPEITYEYIGASNNIVTASVVTVLLALHALAASGLLLGFWPRSCAIISFALQFWRIHQNDEVPAPTLIS